MKVGLLLQGLADRTTIMHPHPEGGLNLLDQDAIDAGRVVLIPGAEDTYMLGDGHERSSHTAKTTTGAVTPVSTRVPRAR